MAAERIQPAESGAFVERQAEETSFSDGNAYMVGTVSVDDSSGTPKKILTLRKARGKKILSEDEVPFLRMHEAGDLLALYNEPSEKSRPPLCIENLGKAGTQQAEKAGLAYSIGCGRVFPPPVQEEVRLIEEKGESMIHEEISALATAERLKSAASPTWQEEYKHGSDRVDFRDVLTMTVDPKTAKDFDDALSVRTVEVQGKKYTEIGIHIADVSHFLSMQPGKNGHEMYKEALRRQFTAYFEGEAFPMLPHILSERLCSLEEGKDRFAFSTVFLVDPDTKKITNTWHGKTVIKSAKRFSYEDAEKLRVSSDSLSHDDEQQQIALRTMTEVGQALRATRENRGAVSFPERDEAVASYDSSGNIVGIETKHELEMNKVIADWMIRANEAVALKITTMSLTTDGVFPTFLRAHRPPPISALKAIAQEMHFNSIVDDIDSFERANALNIREDQHEEATPFVNKIARELLKRSQILSPYTERNVKEGVANAIAEGREHPLLGKSDDETASKISAHLEILREAQRSKTLDLLMELFSKAKYVTENQTHFGLSAFPYTHATSPIRRFPDIIVHTLLDEVLKGHTVSLFNEASTDTLSSIAKHANTRELLIKKSSRISWRIRGADLLSKQIGSPIKIYIDGVSGKEVKGPPLLFVRAWINGRFFPVSFVVRQQDFINLPKSIRDIKKLEGQEMEVTLREVDVSRGSLALESSAAANTTPKQRISETYQGSESVRKVLLTDIAILEQQFQPLLSIELGFATALSELKLKVEKTSQKTPPHALESLATEIGSLRVRMLYMVDTLPTLSNTQPSNIVAADSTLEARDTALINLDLDAEEIEQIQLQLKRARAAIIKKRLSNLN